MVQEFIVYLIITIAIGFAIHNILGFFNLGGKKVAKSGSCAGCSSGCEMKELHVMNKRKITKRDQYRFYL